MTDTNKRLFTVPIETEIVVLADSEEQAQEIAQRYVRKIDWDQWDVTHATAMRHLPGGWDGSCIPYGDGDPGDPDRTVAQWIECGAAPLYTELLGKLKAAKAKHGE